MVPSHRLPIQLQVYTFSGQAKSSVTAKGGPPAALAQVDPHLVRYEGDFKAGLPHGQGFGAWDDGSTYRGPWEEGKRHGDGGEFYRPAAPTPMQCVGNWTRGFACGGTITWPSGIVYQGPLYDGLPHGVATLQVPAGQAVQWLGGFVPGVRDAEFGRRTSTPVYQNLGQASKDAVFAALREHGVITGGGGGDKLALADAAAALQQYTPDRPALALSPGYSAVPKVRPDAEGRPCYEPAPVRLFQGTFVQGWPHGSCSFQTHRGVAFRGWAGCIVRGWPSEAYGVVEIAKSKPMVDGRRRVKVETGCFHHGLLNGVGKRTWVSKAGAERVKHGNFVMGEWRAGVLQGFTYMVNRHSGGDEPGWELAVISKNFTS